MTVVPGHQWFAAPSSGDVSGVPRSAEAANHWRFWRPTGGAGQSPGNDSGFPPKPRPRTAASSSAVTAQVRVAPVLLATR